MPRRAASPRVSRVSQRRCADAYARACLRLGRRPAPDVELDLREHGALVLDMQLCRDLEPLLVFLREAPPGIHQVVLYNGLLFFGADENYNVKLSAAEHRTPGSIVRDQVQLRRLVAALSVFCSVRGSDLAVLELSGLPIGRHDHQALTASLGRCLTPLPSLQRLHLAGCALQDQGLKALLPQLTNGLPKLSHLSLAKNSLRDVRLVARLLQSRAEAQRRRLVVPFSILDLSQNPSLGALKSGKATFKSTSPRRAWDTRRNVRPERRSGRREQQGQMHPPNREPLLRVLCQAIRAGLMIKTLRLRSMQLGRDDLRPLLQLLSREIAHHKAGFSRDFPLAEVSLEGNHLEPEFPAAVSNALGQLSTINRTYRAARYDQTVKKAQFRPPVRQVRAYVSLRRSQSLPASRRQSDGTIVGGDFDLPERDALSEADIDNVEELSQHLTDPQHRIKLQQQFKGELAILAGLLETRGYIKTEFPSYAVHIRANPREASHVDSGHYGECRRHQIAMQRASASGAAEVTSSDESRVAVDAIPDRGEEMGFGPPVLPGTYSQSSDESSDGDHAHGGPTTTQHLAGAKADHHAKLQILRDLFHDGGNIPVGPEVLRFTLDLISSETSLNAEGEEAVQMLAAHIAEVRGMVAEVDDDDDDVDELDELDEESHDEQAERLDAPPGHRGPSSRRRRHQERVDAETGAASVSREAAQGSGWERRPERAFSM